MLGVCCPSVVGGSLRRRRRHHSQQAPATTSQRAMATKRVLYADQLKNLTVRDLKADPTLAVALRQLKQTLAATTSVPASAAPASAAPLATSDRGHGARSTVASHSTGHGAQPSVVSHTNVWHVDKSLTEAPTLVLRPTSSSSRPRVVANKLPSAGTYTVSSPGPGWMGPACAMESYRRPLGPGQV